MSPGLFMDTELRKVKWMLMSAHLLQGRSTTPGKRKKTCLIFFSSNVNYTYFSPSHFLYWTNWYDLAKDKLSSPDCHFSALKCDRRQIKQVTISHALISRSIFYEAYIDGLLYTKPFSSAEDKQDSQERWNFCFHPTYIIINQMQQFFVAQQYCVNILIPVLSSVFLYVCVVCNPPLSVQIKYYWCLRIVGMT